MIVNLFTCPCCGYKTLENPPGHFDICSICYWEDDTVQREDIYFEGGANEVSLFQAQKNFTAFGASDKAYISSVRKPSSQDVRDATFKF